MSYKKIKALIFLVTLNNLLQASDNIQRQPKNWILSLFGSSISRTPIINNSERLQPTSNDQVETEQKARELEKMQFEDNLSQVQEKQELQKSLNQMRQENLRLKNSLQIIVDTEKPIRQLMQEEMRLAQEIINEMVTRQSEAQAIKEDMNRFKQVIDDYHRINNVLNRENQELLASNRKLKNGYDQIKDAYCQPIERIKSACSSGQSTQEIERACISILSDSYNEYEAQYVSREHYSQFRPQPINAVSELLYKLRKARHPDYTNNDLTLHQTILKLEVENNSLKVKLKKLQPPAAASEE